MNTHQSDQDHPVIRLHALDDFGSCIKTSHHRTCCQDCEADTDSQRLGTSLGEIRSAVVPSLKDSINANHLELKYARQ